MRMFGRRVPSVDVSALPAGAVVVDVREDDEWQAGHIDGALHVPLMTLPTQLDAIPRDVPVAVVCRVGGRSAQAVQFLVQNGIDAVNVDDGMLAWAAAGLPMVASSPDAEPFVL
jgi:rhodanese-related sulfurtransferase